LIPASSTTERTGPPAIKPLPAFPGRIKTTAPLNFKVTSAGIVPLTIGISINDLRPRLIAF
jgi:hypothetical protein